jgi:hypothetical protein
MIMEFKKFMFLCALRIANDKEKKFEMTDRDGKIYYRSPFPAPPII